MSDVVEGEITGATLEPFPSLRHYQREGVAFLIRNESALLADEMGLGKTVQAAVALEVVLRADPTRRALVVCPSSLRLNWERELSHWAPQLAIRRVRGNREDREAHYLLPIQVLITSYEQLRIDSVHIANLAHFDVVILDEAQRIKNRHSNTALACTILDRRVSWALTATPVENAPEDLTAILMFVRRGLVQSGLPRTELHQRMRPYFLRRRKQDVLPELPPIIEQELVVELTTEQRRIYDDVWATRQELVREGRGPSQTGMLALITRLKQLCNFDDVSGESSKAEILDTILESASEPDDKIIIFSQFVETLQWLSARQNRIPASVFHGALSEDERDALVENFENRPGPSALFVSLRAGGVGLNLQSASTVVMFDRWWNPAVEDQAIQRAHRFGRGRPLHVVRFLTFDSIEERIDAVISSKRTMIEDYTESAMNAEVRLFTLHELMRLLDIVEPVDTIPE